MHTAVAAWYQSPSMGLYLDLVCAMCSITTNMGASSECHFYT